MEVVLFSLTGFIHELIPHEYLIPLLVANHRLLYRCIYLVPAFLFKAIFAYALHIARLVCNALEF